MKKRALIAFLCGGCVTEWRTESSSAPSDAVLPRLEPLVVYRVSQKKQDTLENELIVFEGIQRRLKIKRLR